MMALSGNDAAAAVAKFAAGSEERYLEWANGPMKSEYSLSDNTFFGRAYGRDCYSTAEDLGKLVRAMLQDANLSSLLWQYAGATETAGKVAIVGTDGECDLVSRKNTHPFISGPYRDWIEYYIGDECEVCGKTGTWIVEHSLITVVRSKGRTLLCVVAAAPNATLRDETTLSLFSWGFSSKE